MHERKALMAPLSDAFIALPRGIGTLEEITEIITFVQLGYHQKPCGIFNIASYFDTLISFLDQMVPPLTPRLFRGRSRKKFAQRGGGIN